MLKKPVFIILLIFVIIGAAGIYFFFLNPGSITASSGRHRRVVEWITNPAAHLEWSVTALDQCSDSLLVFPTSGYIGYLWDDSFRVGHRHSGIDIFSPEGSGETPVYAAYDGYLSRLSDWKSTVIIRIPSDPLQPNRQIWMYYTHMADEQGNSYILDEFPPGTMEEPVSAGDLIGYQGNFSGTPGNPTGIHLHFSIVKDNGQGEFLNELDIENTIDPSPYFMMNLNANENTSEIPSCQ